MNASGGPGIGLSKDRQLAARKRKISAGHKLFASVDVVPFLRVLPQTRFTPEGCAISSVHFEFCVRVDRDRVERSVGTRPTLCIAALY